MKNFTIRPYLSKDYNTWNAFIAKAKNATFLFHRDFMEYHSDRFEDFSLMVFDNEKLVGLLPANKAGDIVYSHQGLTYGGLIYGNDIRLAALIDIFKTVLFFLKENNVETLQVKTVPFIYHNQPAEELNYVLFLADASLIRRDALSVVDLSKPYSIKNNRKEGIKKGITKGLKIKETDSFDEFWNEILIQNLEEKHQVKPVHTLAEITFLKSKFPENIRQFNIYDNDKIVAGTTVFESLNVVHSQYISGNKDQNKNGGLDFLYHHLLTEVFSKKHYFDFGNSNEQQGKKLNFGLSFWKESFGASTVVQDFYEVKTSNFSKLENVLI